MDLLDIFHTIINDAVDQVLKDTVAASAYSQDQRASMYSSETTSHQLELFENVMRLNALLHAGKREVKDGQIVANHNDRRVAETLMPVLMKGGTLIPSDRRA